MKTLLLLIACITIGFAAKTQTSDAEAEAIVNLLGVQKKEVVRKLIAVQDKDSAVFWKLYDEYQRSNIQTAKDRIRLYEQTALSYGNMTPGIADSLSKRYFVNRDLQEKKLEEYYKKIKAATNAVTAFEFYQAEVYLLTQIRANIMQQIPTYGQFQLAKKKE